MSSRSEFGDTAGSPGLGRSLSIKDELMMSKWEVQRALRFVEGWRGRLRKASDSVDRVRGEGRK